MRILAFLSELSLYRDRVLAWQYAAERVGSMTLLTLSPPPELHHPKSSALHIVPLADRPLRGLAGRLALLRYWHEVRPAVDLLHDAQGLMLPLFARLGSSGPIRLSSIFASSWDWLHDLRGRHPVEWRGRELRNWTYLAQEWGLARACDAFTVFGEGHRAACARAWHIPESRIFSIPNCADPKWFSPDGPRADTGFRADPVLLFVGQIFRYKGVHELIDALALLRPRHPRLRLLLVGDVPPGAEAPVCEHIERLRLADHIRLPGPVARKDLPALLRAASIVVLPSYSEGSPRVLIEAMACARPIVATNLPGIAALDPGGEAISLVPRGDAVALAEGLERFLMNAAEAEAAGERNRRRYLSHHTPEAAGEALAEVYRRLVP